MAIDSRTKRQSAIHVGLPHRFSLQDADGAISQADRQHAARLYSGIAAATSAQSRPGGGGLFVITVMAAGRRRGAQLDVPTWL